MAVEFGPLDMLAEVRAMGPPTAAQSPSTNSWSGTRTPTVWKPGLSAGLREGLRGRTIVTPPGRSLGRIGPDPATSTHLHNRNMEQHV